MNWKTFRTGWRRAMEAHYKRNVSHTDTKAIVLEKARAIYIPMPKAANSSIRKALLPVLGIDPQQVSQVQAETRHLTEPCSTALPKAGPDWMVFTVVREPYDRAHSAWRDKLENQDSSFRSLRGTGLEKGDSFSLFLLVCNLWPRKMLNDHFIPQTDLLEQARKLPDFRIYRMEDLGRDWPGICDEIEERSGIRPLDLPHLNQSRKPEALSFPPGEKLMLWRLYNRDRKPLGYG